MSLAPVDLVDDEVVFSGFNRDFIIRKVFGHLPAGSFNIICVGGDGEVVTHLLNQKAMVFLEIWETWKQMKRLLGSAKDLATWESPICCERPEPLVLSTCDNCLNDMCMSVLFYNSLCENPRGDTMSLVS